MKIRTKISLSLAFCVMMLFITVSIVYEQLNQADFYRERAKTSQEHLIDITDFRAKVRSRLLKSYEALVDPSMASSLSHNTINTNDLPIHDKSEEKAFAELIASYNNLDASLDETEAQIIAHNLTLARSQLIQSKKLFEGDFIPKMKRVIKIKEDNNEKSSLDLKQNILKLKSNLFTLAGAALIITTALSIFISISLGKKFRILEQATHEIARGNETFRIPVQGKDELAQISSSFNEMTETLKESRDQLLLNQQKLFLISKNSALGEMATGLGHEINNPLAIITMALKQLKKNLEKDHQKKESNLEAVDDIQSATDRITKLVKGLRLISRDSGDDPLIKVSLTHLIEETIDLIGQRFQDKNVNLVFVKGREKSFSDEVECRQTEISQVILSLLSNSLDAIESLEERWVEIAISRQEDTFEVDLIDSGHGIPKDILDKMMNPFFTTKEIGKGTGLGLTISKGVMSRHQGNLVVVENTVNTTFRISLPKFQKKAS